jgi:hypothetical protein
MAKRKTFSIDDLCSFMSEHNGTLTVKIPKGFDGRPLSTGTHLRLDLHPDGYRHVWAKRMVPDDDLATRPQLEKLAMEVEAMVREVERKHPRLKMNVGRASLASDRSNDH